MPNRSRHLALALASVLWLGAPQAARTAPALPDTGLFAPVAAQYRSRLAALADSGAAATPERVHRLLASGRLDEAVRTSAALAGDARAADAARARALLAVQDFAALAPLMARIEAQPAPNDDERSLRYAWAATRDDAASVDSLTRAALAGPDAARRTPEWLAAGRLAFSMLDYARADSMYHSALASLPPGPAPGPALAARRAAALTGRALVQQKRRDWDGSLATLREALGADGNADVLMALTETLIRLGRTDEAISAAEWAVLLSPCNDAAHYLLGNGYARRNYTQLAAAYPGAFADAAGRRALTAADALLAAGKRAGARAAYASLVRAHPDWADARVRLASLDFEDGHFAEARAGCVAALAACPEYGRAHAVLAKALESERFGVDVNRSGYEARFAASAMPQVPGIEKFVTNWKSLSPRHQKRVALSVAPWRRYLPVLIDGGATYYIKPMYMLLSECPAQRTLRDQRISYDSRLWDDVRGCGGYHTVTGIEDVERTIFDRYNTVLHELTHQVHAVLPADDSRTIQDLYRSAKQRDDSTHDAFLSRYAGGSVYEYFAEGANALDSPMRDRFDPREVVRERLVRVDPALLRQVQALQARTDLSGSYPVAYAAGGDDRVERGEVDAALPFYRKALALEPANETAMLSLANALLLANRANEADSAAVRAVRAHSTSGPAWTVSANAAMHAGEELAAVRAMLVAARPLVRAGDRSRVDLAIGRYAWIAGDAGAALAAYDSVLAEQSDSPEGMQGRAAALALAGRYDEAFEWYDKAVRVRTGIADLRCDYARDLLRAGRMDAARAQLDAAKLLDEENPTAEALRGWAELASHSPEAARRHAEQALAWGPWCDLAAGVFVAASRQEAGSARADSLAAALTARMAANTPPRYVFRPGLATWEEVHVLPAVERRQFADWGMGGR